MKSSDPIIFDVDSDGVITVPGIPEPKVRADVFERVDPQDVHTAHDLIRLVKCCEPLAERFRQLSRAYLAKQTQPSAFLETLLTQRSLRTGTQQLIVRALRRNPEEGWRHWIEYSGETALERFLQHVRDWLEEDIVWGEVEYFDPAWNGQAAAFAYFDEVPVRILRAVGVKLVDGDVPGSNYQAAILCKGLEQANEAAQRLDQGLRFEMASAVRAGASHG